MLSKPTLQPIDKLAISLILSLGVVIGGLIYAGTFCGEACLVQTGPRVKEFSWSGKTIGVEDKAFILTFDRPMDHASVEKNLVIDPPLPGKFSWAGRRLAYTLKSPIPYGETYEVQLEGAREHFRSGERAGQPLQSFVGQFKSRDRAFAYIGTDGAEQGRLILYNLTEQKKTLLTPANLNVMAFEFYPEGEKILFSAAAKNQGFQGIRELELYQVSTEKGGGAPIEKVLDNRDYQNNQFDLSPDGKTIVVQRVNRQNPADFDLWMIGSDRQPRRLNTPGGDFTIAPDGKTIAVAQGEGIALLPLETEAKPLDFLPKFGRVLSFSPDGTAAAMVNFNTDNAKLRYARSLFYVNNQGLQKRLLDVQGSIVDCHFNASGSDLYCLLTQLAIDSQEYQETPYLARINVHTGKLTPLLELPNYRDIRIGLSPDGLAILFDQIMTSENATASNPLSTDSGEAIAGGRLWMLIPPIAEDSKPSKPDLIELPLAGIRPQWMP
jgi:Tol biopolymer transport system component